MGYFEYDPAWHMYCTKCKKHRPWYRFKVDRNTGKEGVCLKCQDTEVRIRAFVKLHKLVRMAEKNKMSGLRDHLFGTIDGLKNKSITPQEAKSICEVAQVIINSAKVEIEFIKLIGAKKSDFLQIEDREENTELQQT